MFDKDTLCFHCKAVCDDLIADHFIQSWVGRLQALEETTFKAYTQELSSVISRHLEGELFLRDIPLEHIGVRMNRHHENFQRLAQDYTSESYEPIWVFKEPFLNRLFNLPPNNERVQRLLAALMKLKTVLTRDKSELTTSEIQEIHGSLTTRFTGDLENLRALRGEIEEHVLRFLEEKNIPIGLNVPFLDPEVSMTIREFASTEKSFSWVDANGRIQAIERSNDKVFDCSNILRVPEVYDLYVKYPREFMKYGFLGQDPSPNQHIPKPRDMFPHEKEIPLISISMIMELGWKNRVVAVPTALMQSLSYRLGITMKHLNSMWRIIGVDSHVNTCEFLREHISRSNGTRTYHSVDLSSWTDRFPYPEFQQVIVETLAKVGIITYFDKEVMDWICASSVNFEGRLIKYGVGTPMGTFPSFPLATFCHGILLWMAFTKAHPDKRIDIDDLPARIIGDDIVIWDEATYFMYLHLIQDILGVKVQMTKCINSKHFIELCSKLISPDGVYQQRKLKPFVFEDLEDAIHKVEYYGPEILWDYPLPIQEAIEDLLNIPKPFGLADVDLADLESTSSLNDTDKLFRAVQLSREYISKDAPMNSQEWIHLVNRRKHSPVCERFPKSLQPTGYSNLVSRRTYSRSPELESLRLDLSNLSDLILDPRVKFEDRLLLAERIHAIVNRLSAILEDPVSCLDTPPITNHISPVRFISEEECKDRSVEDVLSWINLERERLGKPLARRADYVCREHSR